MLFVALLLVATNVLMVIGGVYTYVKVNRFTRQVAGVASDVFVPKSESQPSLAGEAISSVSEHLAEQIGVKVQAAIRGSIGGTMKGVNAALESEAMAENPNAALIKALPKSLRNNQVALMGLQAIINRVSQGGNNNHGPGNYTGQTKFTL